MAQVERTVEEPSPPRRRAAYGAASPDLGDRARATRQRILDCAVHEFGERGYFATSMDDIAVAAEVSRATIYQYFSGKEQIFEDLVTGMGGDLFELVRHMGPVGPTAEGYASLRAWVEGFVALYRRFAPVFIQWSDVMPSSERLLPLASRWTRAYCAVLTDRLRQAGAAHDDVAVAMAVLGMSERASYYLAMQHTRVGAATLLGELTTSIQVTLFPSTPPDVLAAAS